MEMPQYSERNSTITLEQAIEELRQKEEKKGNSPTKISNEISQTLDKHDAVHILFGCDTTIKDEIAAHVWMLCGTTAKLDEMHQAIAHQEHRNVLSNIGHLKLMGIWILLLPRILSIMLRCLSMKKRLSLEEIEKLKKQPLYKIRQEYGIIV